MGRTQTTIRIDESLIDDLDSEAEQRGVSRSEYIRQILQNRHEADELDDEVQRLQDRLESREKRIEQLEEQLARRSQLEEKVDTLAKQEQESNAPFFIKWYRWYKSRDE